MIFIFRIRNSQSMIKFRQNAIHSGPEVVVHSLSLKTNTYQEAFQNLEYQPPLRLESGRGNEIQIEITENRANIFEGSRICPHLF